jgi:putative component of toxin-antitoxin plasmid stabilization module
VEGDRAGVIVPDFFWTIVLPMGNRWASISSVQLQAYETDKGRCPYEDWFSRLDGTQRRAVQRRLRAIEEDDHFGDRKRLSTEKDGKVVILLGGSGKGNQDREIEKAKERLQDYQKRR